MHKAKLYLVALEVVSVDGVSEQAVDVGVQVLHAVRPASHLEGAVLDAPRPVVVVDLAKALEEKERVVKPE